MNKNFLLKSGLVLAVLSSTLVAASLKGRVFEDTNRNNIYDKAIDLPLKNVLVSVVDAQGKTVQVKTNKYGVYTAKSISTGVATITIDETTLPGVNPVQVVGLNPSTKNVVSGKQNWAGKDGFTFDILTGTVCGDLFLDGKNDTDPTNPQSSITYNNVFNKGEEIANATVSIIDSRGNEHNATSNINGRYCVEKVAVGTATINVYANNVYSCWISFFTNNNDSNHIDVVHINKINEAPVGKALLVCP